MMRALLTLLGILTVSHAQASTAEDFGLTLGGELRERATYVSAIDFDENTDEDGWFWTQRLSLDATWLSAGGFKVHTTFLSAVQEGNDTNPVDNNHLDWQQAYVAWQNDHVELRVGRQEMILGSQRLVGLREGTNVRRTWDGVRLNFARAEWQADVFSLYRVEVEPTGTFNDSTDRDEQLSGIYLTRNFRQSSYDIYYLHSDRKERSTVEGNAEQERHTIGARAFGDHASWFWNWEAVYQFGDHGDLDIEAWTLATNTGYRFAAPWSPELMLSANVSSGDKRSGDGKLGTFDALYPRGNYFSSLALLGPSNFYNVNPYLRLQPRPDLALALDVNFHYRLEAADGIYGPPGNLLRTPDGVREKSVNTAASVEIEWQMNANWVTSLIYTHSAPEAFIEATGPADDINFVELTLKANF